ncbi:MAG: Crp/Fnr family transcriptional regulator [Acidobacteriota bacterium]
MRQEAVDFLARAPIFRRLAPPDRLRIAEVADVKRYRRGETIFSEGDAAESFYVVADGRVKIAKMTPAGNELILEIFGVGDPLGAVAVYEGLPFPATATAIEDTTCVLIPRQQFFALLEQYPSLVRGLLLGLTTRLVEMTNRLAELTRTRVESRLARLFIKMADQSGRTDMRGLVIPTTLSRQELADLTGTTIETAIRIMSRWHKRGLVLTEKDGFVIADRKALETLALQ